FAPGRTTSGNAILVRNPHLSWSAGYYEAHVKVPDILDFYGDFRIGSPLGIIGGFNNHLGWSTTNNYPETSGEIYAFKVDPNQPDHYLLDESSVPIHREEVRDRKSTRLNSSHVSISYAVFCLIKKITV